MTAPLRQIFYSVTALIICLLLFELAPLDMWLQQLLFDSSDNTWILNNPGKILNFIFYDGIKRLLVIFAIALLISLLFFSKTSFVKTHHRGLLIVLVSLIIVPTVTGLLKDTTNVACPRDIAAFSGKIPYIGLFESYTEETRPAERQRCFPAGHASGGFALMSLYFLFRMARNRRRALYVAVAVGWIMGGYKMLIGHHFLSHTIVTMILAWLLINCVVMIESFVANKKKAC